MRTPDNRPQPEETIVVKPRTEQLQELKVLKDKIAAKRLADTLKEINHPSSVVTSDFDQ